MAMTCAALLSVACGGGASAGRTTTVLLVPSGDAAESSEAERVLRRRITEREDLELTSLARLASLAADAEGEDTDAVEMEAQRRMADADEAFSNFDYAGATTQLAEALELLRPLARRATGRQRLAALHLQLANVLQVHGERDAAIEELRTCRHVDPECRPDPARHPPELITLFEEATAETARAASLRITTDPPGASVSVDGSPPRASPATFEALSPGRHYVTIERDGFRPEAQLVNVAAGEPTERAIALTAGAEPARAQAALRSLRGRGPDAEPLWRAQAAALTEADVLLVLRLDREAFRLALFDARGAPLGDALERDRDDASAALTHLEQTLPEPTLPWYGQWYFWVPVSAGVTFVLVTAALIVLVEPDVHLVGGSVTDGF